MAIISESTAADWDGSQAEEGVHHEQPTGTDWAAADVIERGYPSTVGANMVAHLPFQENSGTTANDVSGTGNDGDASDSGITKGVNGLLGGTAYNFDKSASAQVEVPNDTTLEPTGDFTIAIWAAANAGATPGSNWSYFVGKGDGGTGSDYALIWRATDDRIIFEIENASATPRAESNNAWGPASGITLLTGVWDASVPEASLYLDGTHQQTVSVPNGVQNNQDLLGIGGHPNYNGGSQRQFDGVLGSFMMWKRELSASEISDLNDVVRGQAEYWADKKTP